MEVLSRSSHLPKTLCRARLLRFLFRLLEEASFVDVVPVVEFNAGIIKFLELALSTEVLYIEDLVSIPLVLLLVCNESAEFLISLGERVASFGCLACEKIVY